MNSKTSTYKLSSPRFLFVCCSSEALSPHSLTVTASYAGTRFTAVSETENVHCSQKWECKPGRTGLTLPQLIQPGFKPLNFCLFVVLGSGLLFHFFLP